MGFTAETARAAVASVRKCEHCGRNALKTSKWCRKCGAHALSGPLNGNYKHGGYSQYAPKNILPHYNQFLASGGQQVRHERALMQARLAALLETVATGESGELWHALAEAKAEIKKSLDALRTISDPAKLREAFAPFDRDLDHMLSLIDEGVSDAKAWRECRETAEQIRKLAETESKLVKEADATLSAEDVVELHDMFAAVMAEFLPEGSKGAFSARMRAERAKRLSAQNVI